MLKFYVNDVEIELNDFLYQQLEIIAECHHILPSKDKFTKAMYGPLQNLPLAKRKWAIFSAQLSGYQKQSLTEAQMTDLQSLVNNIGLLVRELKNQVAPVAERKAKVLSPNIRVARVAAVAARVSEQSFLAGSANSNLNANSDPHQNIINFN